MLLPCTLPGAGAGPGLLGEDSSAPLPFCGSETEQ